MGCKESNQNQTNTIYKLNAKYLSLTFKVTIKTAADDKNLQKAVILMKYHALFVISENTAKFEKIVCCKL